MSKFAVKEFPDRIGAHLVNADTEEDAAIEAFHLFIKDRKRENWPNAVYVEGRRYAISLEMVPEFTAARAPMRAPAEAEDATGSSVKPFLQRLREVNTARCYSPEGFKHDKDDDWTILEWAAVIAGEAGEIIGAAKKLRCREKKLGGAQFVDPIEGMQATREEVADVILYCDLLLAIMDADFEQTVKDKFNKTSATHGMPFKLE